MKLKTPILLLLVTIFFFSCQKYGDAYKNKDIIYFEESDFGFKKSLVSENLGIESDSIIFPGGIDIIENTLIISDDKATKSIHLFNLNTKSYIGNFGNKGEGPGEVRNAIQLNHIYNNKNDSFFMYDAELRKVIGYSIESLLKNEVLFERKINQKSFCVDLTMLNNDLFYTDYFDYENNFTKLNITTNKEEGFGNLLYNDKGVDNKTFSQACVSNIISNNGRVITAYKYAPFLEIYNLKSNTFSSLLTIDKFSPIFNEEVFGDKKIFAVVQDKTRDGFTAIDATNKYIYLLYSGKVFSLDDFYAHGSTILVFDYDGNPIGYYKLDKPIYDFKVKNDQTIIGLAMDIKTQVLKYDIE